MYGSTKFARTQVVHYGDGVFCNHLSDIVIILTSYGIDYGNAVLIFAMCKIFPPYPYNIVKSWVYRNAPWLNSLTTGKVLASKYYRSSMIDFLSLRKTNMGHLAIFIWIMAIGCFRLKVVCLGWAIPILINFVSCLCVSCIWTACWLMPRSHLHAKLSRKSHARWFSRKRAGHRLTP